MTVVEAVALAPFEPCAVRLNVVVAARLETVNEPLAGCLPTPLSIITWLAFTVTQLRVTGLLGEMVLELAVNETTCGAFTAGGGVLGEAPTPRQPLIKKIQLNSKEANTTVDLRKPGRVINSVFPQ